MTRDTQDTTPGGDSAARVADSRSGQIAGRSAPTRALASLIVVQCLCVVFFLSDAAIDIVGILQSGFSDWHVGMETLAALALLLSVAVQLRVLLHLLTRQRRLAQAVTAAAGGLHDLVEAHFTDWGLTASERDVAWLTLKGMSISETAVVRGSADGTVKAHLHGVYRKSGLQGRAALLAFFFEDLMTGNLVSETDPDGRAATPRADDPARQTADHG